MVNPVGDFPDFTSGILLLGLDASGNQVGVLVDSDGNINAILKGQGATGLQTIAVDENGRLETFVLDAEEQWGKVIRVGNAELAARLGSPVRWDKRGQILHSVSFGQGFPPSQRGTYGTGASTDIVPDFWLYGGYSLKLTGGSDGARAASAWTTVGPNPPKRTGLTVLFSCSGPPDFLQLDITYQYNDAGYRGRVRVDFDNKKVQVLDHTSTWQNVGDVDPLVGDEYWHAFKFVVDFETGQYERVLFDNIEIDVSAYAPLTLGVGSDLLSTSVYVYSHTAENDYIYLDSMILSTLEPENS